MSLYSNTKLLFLTSLIFIFMAVVVILDNTSNTQLVGNIITDTTTTHVQVLPALQQNCSYNLSVGWNMVSFYCLGLYVSRSDALSSLNDSYTSVFMYSKLDSNDPWKSYNPYLPTWTIQQLNYMDRLSGYWVYIKTNDTFSYSGIYSNSQIYLKHGWNFVGFPSNQSSLINDTLGNVSFDTVEHYNLSSNIWLVYVNESSENTLNELNSGKGYWIYVEDNQEWYISKFS